MTSPGAPSVSSRGAAWAERAILGAAATLVMLVAWIWLGTASTAPSHEHLAILVPGAHGGGIRAFLAVVLMWQVMTVAMMTPTFLRWLLVFADLAPSSGSAARAKRIGALTAGYLAAWLLYSAAAAAVQQVLQGGDWLRHGRVAAIAGGSLLMLAGIFQLAPVKRACLSHCRNPLSFFLARWRGGPGGGFRLGAIHGAYCVGCCWLLMATGFAMGVMNVVWMAVLTIVVVAEQVLPRGERIAGALGLAMAGWGLALVFL